MIRINQLKMPLGHSADSLKAVSYTHLGKEMSAYDRKYTEEELKDIAGREKELFAEKLTEKGVQILENNDRIETSATKCTITGQFVTLEQIQKAAPLAQEEIIPNIEPEETKATQ